MTIGTPALWIAFNLFVLAMLALDLGVFNRKAHAPSLKEAAIWSGVWIALALAFSAGLYVWQGPEIGTQFLTGYLIEKSLSVDNIFVFVLIFSTFAVPATYQHRVLFWGVFGALVMRGVFIALGAALLDAFHWIIYLFGAFLVFTGIRIARHKEQQLHPDKNPLVRLARRFVPITTEYAGARFFVRQAGRSWATPLLLVLLVIESTDLVFALDSIPAIFAVSSDAFIVYTSNVFAILGLRSLYFVLAGVVRRFRYLSLGLAVVLVFVGVKMLLTDLYHIPSVLSLAVVAVILTAAVVASLLRERATNGKRGGEPGAHTGASTTEESRETRVPLGESG
ncbi:MAG TPA: TerC family protein [Ktedonobacterales bacterium]|nr:TerC family protein [Ktedonobacterales bacterium]